jgi:translation initiation factor IF-2
LATRVHLLAKELGVTSKAILDKCRAEGLDVKNHMTVLSLGLEATIREWFSEGAHTTTEEKTERVNLDKIKRRKRKSATAESAGVEIAETGEGIEGEEFEEFEEVELAETEAETAETVPAPAAPSAAEQPAVSPAETPVSPAAVVQPPAVVAAEKQEQKVPAEPKVQEKVPQAKVPAAPAEAVQPAPSAESIVLKPAARVELPEKPATPPAGTVSEKKEALHKKEIPGKKPAKQAPEVNKPELIKPVGPMNVPAPAVLRGPRVVRIERPEIIPRPVPSRDFSPRSSAMEPNLPPRAVPGKVGKKSKTAAQEEEAARLKKAKNRLNPRRGRTTDTIEQLKEWRDRDLLERSQRLAQASDHPTTVRRAETKKPKTTAASAAAPKQGKIQISEPIILKDFCSAIGVPFSKIFPKLMAMGIPATINQSIASEQAELLAIDLGIEIEIQKQKSHYEEMADQFTKMERPNKKRRSPVVTFLGHVDHGKTSLLDRIRHAQVAAGEAGGITQKVGAYRCPINDRFVVFLDTPGHEAFTEMRARGAQMTDIVVLVVAADDGVMPQTKEAISHAKAANVPIVVAMNKIDLPQADPNKVMGQLSENGLIPTEWGGDVDIVRTSATTGEGVTALVELLSTLSDLLDLKADPTGPATGLVIESHQDPNRGPVADMLVQEGTLNITDVIVVGRAYGRIRAMFDDKGNSIKEAGPATPVEILGLDMIPEPGDRFFITEDQKLAQEIADEKRQEDRSEYLQSRPKVTLENIFQQVEAGEAQYLNLIVKTDTQGSMDVLRAKLAEMGSNEVKVRVLHTAVGGITEGDVILANASDAIILGFGVVADDQARSKAQFLNVEIRTYTVIYHLFEDMTSALEGMLTPTYEQKVLGRAVVRDVFKLTKVGTIAGCMVIDGLVERSAKLRIIRQNVIIRENAVLESLKRFKDDAKEVRQGFECGIKIAGFDDIKEGDILEAYQMVEVTRKLQPANGN